MAGFQPPAMPIASQGKVRDSPLALSSTIWRTTSPVTAIDPLADTGTKPRSTVMPSACACRARLPSSGSPARQSTTVTWAPALRMKRSYHIQALAGHMKVL